MSGSGDLQRNLDAALERFRRLVEASPEAIYVLREGVVSYANPAFAATVRLTAAELEGRPFVDLLHGDDHAAAFEQMHHAHATGVPTPPTAIRLASPGERVLELSFVRVEYDDGPALMGLGRDVTERRRMQASLLATDRLATVGLLAAGVAHEINNPLTYVVLNLETLARKLDAAVSSPELAAVLRSHLVEAREGVDRVTRIVQDLRAFARPAEERRGAVDLKRVVETTLRIAAKEVRNRAQLDLDLQPVPAVVGDEARLAQVVLNLITNAIHALPDDGKLHRVGVATRTAPTGWAIVEVSDSGDGIPPGVIGRIFDPFFTTKPPGVGTGLGLSICHGIVLGLGGQIEVDSKLGRGTTFRVALPAAIKPAPSTRPSTVPPVPRRLHVLVIDDEPAVAAALARALGDDHDVVVASSSQAGLDQLLAGAAFDVVLCDLYMPAPSGMDVHDALAAAAPGLERRLLFMTGGAMSARAREFLERVPNPRLEKPFDAGTLLGALTAWQVSG